MKSYIIKALLLGVLVTFNLPEVAAQRMGNQAPGRSGTPPGKSGHAPGQSKPNKPTGVPIDGGAGILLAAGAAYGLKKLRDYRVNSKRENQG